MKCLVIGDSNFRDLFISHEDEITKDSGVPVSFEYASSVTSIKTVLDDIDPDTSIVFIANPTNEVAQRSKNNTKSREGIIEAVMSELYDVINPFAQQNEKVMVVTCYPIARQDPPWLEGKLNFYKECLRKVHNSTSQGNVHLGSDIEIGLNLLKGDRVHLNKEGLKKLSGHLINDIKIAIRESNTYQDPDDQMESPSTQTEFVTPPTRVVRSLRKTPARNKRQNEESGEDEVRTKKKRSNEGKIDTVLDKLDLFLKEMREERKTNTEKFTKIETVLQETKASQEEIKEEVKKLKEGDNCFSASVREDLDAMDNLNARDTVVIKKLATDQNIPSDKKELSTLIINAGKEILTQIMGNDSGMKFIAPLYYKNKRRVPKEGERKELPPFKIVFKHLSEAITFKEKTIAASKDPESKLYKAYVSTQQNVGTRVRLALLWGVASFLKKDNKESWVSQSSPKPTLMVKQAGNTTKTYSFIEAMTSYGENIDKKTLEDASKLAKRFFYGQVEKIFIVLKD
jgi:hypothetical protein